MEALSHGSSRESSASAASVVAGPDACFGTAMPEAPPASELQQKPTSTTQVEANC